MEYMYIRKFSKEKLLAAGFILISLCFIGRLFGVIWTQLNAPFDLVFETPNLGVIKFIQIGGNPYNPDTYSKPPFILPVYTPIYHYIVASLPVLEKNPYFTGRVVSMAAMFLSAFSLFFIRRNKHFSILSFLAFGLFFSIWTVMSNTAFLKNDTLALFFSVSAVIIVHNYKSRQAIIIASFFCILSVFTKQSYISAFITCFIYFLITDRNNFGIFLLTSSALSVISIFFVTEYWGKGFWFCTIDALQQQISIYQFASVWTQILKQPMYWFLLGLTVTVTIDCYQKKTKLFQTNPFFLYIIISFLMLTLTLGKTGSSTNYFFEFTLSQLIWLTFILGNKPLSSYLKPIRMIGVILFIICSIIEFTLIQMNEYSFTDRNKTLQKIRVYNNTKMKLSELGFDDPLILDLVDHRHITSLTDRIAFNDPYQYKILWQDGILDYHPFINSLKNQYFDVIMLPKRKDWLTILKKPYDEILNAVFKHYRIIHSDYSYHYLIRKKG